MNILTGTIRKTLEDLDSGLKGALNITDDMEDLGNSMFLNMQPDIWVKYAYFSLKALGAWFDDLMLRITQLQDYSEELIAPKSLWISGLFNPMSFLTSIKQVTARRDNLALDDMVLKTDVVNFRDPADIPEAAANGAFIHGFFLQGAAWELGRGSEQGNLMDMIPKELSPELPVMHVTSINRVDQISAGFYDCPVYVTSARGGTFVFTAKLKMESEEFDHKTWILSGVALLMAPE
jgi:dynein heavy chain, axonemal